MKKRIIVIVAIIALVAILGYVLVACNKEKSIEDYSKQDFESKLKSSLNSTDYEFEIYDGDVDEEIEFTWCVYAENKTDSNKFIAIYKWNSEELAQDFFEKLIDDPYNERYNYVVLKYNSTTIYGSKELADLITK